MSKSFLPTKTELEQSRKWHLIDASEATLGRIASRAAVLLKGKHNRKFTPSMDCGDFVVIKNAAKMRITGDKMTQKTYFRHSGYAGGAKIIPFKDKMSKDPADIVLLAVKRMLDSNRLRSRQMKRLKVFNGDDHTFNHQFGA
jgi:large subunit ribosomal protein L13